MICEAIKRARTSSETVTISTQPLRCAKNRHICAFYKEIVLLQTCLTISSFAFLIVSSFYMISMYRLSLSLLLLHVSFLAVHAFPLDLKMGTLPHGGFSKSTNLTFLQMAADGLKAARQRYGTALITTAVGRPAKNQSLYAASYVRMSLFLEDFHGALFAIKNECDQPEKWKDPKPSRVPLSPELVPFYIEDVNKTLGWAIDRVTKAGLRGPFSSVSLFKFLRSDSHQYTYSFETVDGSPEFINVDTMTGQVRRFGEFNGIHGHEEGHWKGSLSSTY